MTDTTFTTNVTVIEADWLNDVNATAYGVANVKHFGAVGDGVTDDSVAFNAAWASIKYTGGTLVVPPAAYNLNAQWELDVDLTAPRNYQIMGYGAELLASSSVTGHAVRVYKGFNNFGVEIKGLHFNHRGNVTVDGCIQALGAANLRIVRCSMESHDTKAGYSAIDLGPHTIGNADTNSFWTLIDGFTTRQRSGGDGTDAAIGVQLRGAANATKIIHCSFGGVVDAIALKTDGVAVGLPNTLRVLENDFEGVTNAITINTALPATTMPVGLQIAFNRTESATTFINITGAAVLNAQAAPCAYNNYLTVGSVTNYIVNPNNQYFFINEPAWNAVDNFNKVGGNSDYRIVTEGTGFNVVLGNISDASSWSAGHLVLGNYHIWIDTSNGKLMIKGSAPTSASDGTIVGTQS